MFVPDTMQSDLSLPHLQLGVSKKSSLGWASLGTLTCVVVFVCMGCTQQSESTPAEVGPNSNASAPAPVVLSGPRWLELTNGQRLILRPLAAKWDSLASTHKSKWIVVAQEFPARSTTDQQKLQERMAEWAALTPLDRERARLNFAETKKLKPADRAAEWAAYQELSVEERKRLAAKSNPNPVGAAVAISPVPNDKITAVPITRRTIQTSDAITAAKPQIDPNTLLPKLAMPPPSIPAPEIVEPAPALGGTPPITIDTLSPN
jgi:virulence-associated protein VagC